MRGTCDESRGEREFENLGVCYDDTTSPGATGGSDEDVSKLWRARHAASIPRGRPATLHSPRTTSRQTTLRIHGCKNITYECISEYEASARLDS